ncbi:MAG: sortase [Actinomycetota bacterium]
MGEIDENQEQTEEEMKPEELPSSFEKRQEARENRRLNIVRAIAGVLVVLSLAYAYYVFSQPPLKVDTSKITTATDTAKKAVAKGLQPGRIYIPRLGVDEAVNVSPSGTVTQEELLKGATFYNGETNKPGTGNCVVFGHSAVTAEHGAPFGAIGDGLLKIGDQVYLTNADNVKFKYAVTEMNEIEATDFSVVQPLGEDALPRLTIITCIAPNYPRDTRLAVIAELQK